MDSSIDIAPLPPQKWTYVSVTVLDGQRKLKPTHVRFDRLYFNEPPKINGTKVEIIVINGGVRSHQVATVLPHNPEGAEVPIQLLSAQ